MLAISTGPAEVWTFKGRRERFRIEGNESVDECMFKRAWGVISLAPLSF
jgi:hypothetical protein